MPPRPRIQWGPSRALQVPCPAQDISCSAQDVSCSSQSRIRCWHPVGLAGVDLPFSPSLAPPAPAQTPHPGWWHVPPHHTFSACWPHCQSLCDAGFSPPGCSFLKATGYTVLQNSEFHTSFNFYCAHGLDDPRLCRLEAAAMPVPWGSYAQRFPSAPIRARETLNEY